MEDSKRKEQKKKGLNGGNGETQDEHSTDPYRKPETGRKSHGQLKKKN